MLDENKYLTLVTSLPHLGNVFGIRRIPLSWTTLKSRLTMLDEADAHLLEQLDRLFDWALHPTLANDAQEVARYQEIQPLLTTPTLRDMINHRLEIRTVMVALRRKIAGQDTPPTGEPWGYGQWVDTMERHWNDEGLGVEWVYPWIPKARSLLLAHDILELERLILRLVWEHLGKLGERHTFGFEAVAIYVLRWKLARWWTHFEGADVTTLFTTFVDRGLGPSATLFEEGASHAKVI